MEIRSQIKKVFTLKSLPFCRLSYRGGNFSAALRGMSSSRSNEKTGSMVYMVEYPSMRYPLYTGIVTE